jgi:pilus assembly protein CpaE
MAKAEGTEINIVVADHDVKWLDAIAQELSTHPQINVCSYAQSGQAALKWAVSMAADAVFMEYSMPDATAAEITKQLAEDSPGTLVFAVSSSITAQLVQTAKAVGIVEIFPKNQVSGREAAELIVDCVERKRREWSEISLKHGIVEKGVGPQGQKIKTEYISKAITQTIILTYNTKGGVGKSTIAINLAAAIKASPIMSGQRVAIVDFDCGSANVSTVCHISDNDVQNRNLALWEYLSTDLSVKEVDDLLIPGPHGVMIAAAPLNPAVADKINNELADKVLTILKRHFGIIIIDGAPNISAPVDEAINHATHILLIANPEGQSIKQLARMVQLLKPDPEGFDSRDMSHILRKMFVVLNHAQAESKWDLKPADISRAIGRPLMAEIPYSEAVKQALHGNTKKQAIDINPEDPFTIAIKSLANDVCGAYPDVLGSQESPTQSPKKSKLFNFFGRR